MLRRTGRAALLVVAAGCLSGDSGDWMIRVTFNHSTLTKTFRQGDEAPGMACAVTLSRPFDELPPIWFRFRPLEPVFEPHVGLLEIGSLDSWFPVLTPSCALAPDDYSGVLTVDLCRDPACTSKYPVVGNRLPYSIHVSPGFLVSATVDGVPEPGFMTLCGAGGLGAPTQAPPPDFRVRSGQTIVLTSTVPVTWSESVVDFGCGVTLDAVSSTATTWTAVLGNGPSSVPCGWVQVDALEDVPSASHPIRVTIEVGP